MKILLAGPIETAALASATCVTLDGQPRGTTQTPLAPLAAGLLAKGHAVHVVTLDPSVDGVETHRRGALTVTYCPLRGAPRYRARVRSRDLFAREIAHLREVMRAADADVVHAHWTYEFAEAALRSGKPALITMHDLGWDCLFVFRDLYRAMRLAMKYRVMVRVRHLTAVSPFVAARAWQYGHFGKVAVIPNPIQSAPSPAKAVDRPVLVTVGNESRIKNVAASIAAFAMIRVAFPAAELHLFGPGLEPGGSVRGGPGIVFHGKVPHGDLMRFLERDATLLVHPSRIEACPVILSEAKIRGVPVIAGEKSGGTGYVVGGQGGVLVDIERPNLIAAAAIDLLSDAARFADLQREAHADAATRFSVDRVTAEYGAAYERLLLGQSI